jgi:hypothetical protein
LLVIVLVGFAGLGTKGGSGLSASSQTSLASFSRFAGWSLATWSCKSILGQNTKKTITKSLVSSREKHLIKDLLTFCLRTRFVALDYCAAPGLVLTRGNPGQGDNRVY